MHQEPCSAALVASSGNRDAPRCKDWKRPLPTPILTSPELQPLLCDFEIIESSIRSPATRRSEITSIREVTVMSLDLRRNAGASASQLLFGRITAFGISQSPSGVIELLTISPHMQKWQLTINILNCTTRVAVNPLLLNLSRSTCLGCHFRDTTLQSRDGPRLEPQSLRGCLGSIVTSHLRTANSATTLADAAFYMQHGMQPHTVTRGRVSVNML